MDKTSWTFSITVVSTNYIFINEFELFNYFAALEIIVFVCRTQNCNQLLSCKHLSSFHRKNNLTKSSSLQSSDVRKIEELQNVNIALVLGWSTGCLRNYRKSIL